MRVLSTKYPHVCAKSNHKLELELRDTGPA